MTWSKPSHYTGGNDHDLVGGSLVTSSFGSIRVLSDSPGEALGNHCAHLGQVPRAFPSGQGAPSRQDQIPPTLRVPVQLRADSDLDRGFPVTLTSCGPVVSFVDGPEAAPWEP